MNTDNAAAPAGLLVTADQRKAVRVTVNGTAYVRDVEPRRTLADFLREDLGLTGTHTACEYGVCGACTVAVDGTPARSCLIYAVQADGCDIETVESLGAGDDLHPVQQAFWENHGLQCGFCTPGILITVRDMLTRRRGWTEPEIRAQLSGSLCRCTGYQHIVDAVLAADRDWER